ncbi:MAG TPA: ACT domain-containing protein [Terriglobia bacterium]|nr:ACT domain-containing protein [Terriglobia bacterium]
MSLPPTPVPGPLTLSVLADYYAAQFQQIQQNFAETNEGIAVLRARSELVDALVIRLYQEFISADPQEPRHLCLLALGGYGRRELFPHSDIDLLFLTEEGSAQPAYRDAIAAFLRMLWDLRMRVGNSTHTLAECGRLYRDNLEFNVSLLDLRYLAGDADLYTRLRNSVVPHMVARERQELVRNLVELTGQRHAKHGNTIFHLEPNLKDAPGCLRDFHVCRWLARIEELEKNGGWTRPEQLWPERDRPVAERAWGFLADARCFLHYHYGRDDNQLSYDAQAQAAARGVGGKRPEGLAPADWMRIYFRQARAIDQLTAQLMDESAPARSGLYALYQDWRSRLSNADFSVVRGRIFARHPSALASDPLLLLRLFEMAARHGLALSRETEKLVEFDLDCAGREALPPPQLWQQFRRILVQPYAAQALRTMHRLGMLTRLFPEFQAIDSLVIRDFYHRYTVDEHSFMTLENLHRLLREKPPGAQGSEAATKNVGASSAGPGRTPFGPTPGSTALRAGDRKFAEILSEVEQPELLYLALLFHDVGKGFPEMGDHIQGSLHALQGIQARLELAAADWQTVRFLIASHLEMSAASQRRDVFDPETVRDFAKVVATTERLKMLCLFTYADICAVNPEAMTPWKAELLWQLYAATANYLARSVDDERLRITGTSEMEKVLAVLGAPSSAEDLRLFLEGFPRRYTATHTPEQIAGHFELARRLAAEPIAVELRARNAHFELTVVAADRPYLFASITGTLAAWGMNIVKADAFANAGGTILDTFTFVDLHRTLELNPSERDRFKQNLIDVLTRKLELRGLLSGRTQAEAASQPKVEVATRVRFDNQSSSHSTLLELVAQDRPGLLFDVSSVLADQGCNIEVALIDTEGQRAIDVFYLTRRGAKLDPQTQEAVAGALRRR